MPEWLPQQKPSSDSPVQPVKPMTPPTMPEGLAPRTSDSLPAPQLYGAVRQPTGLELPVAPPALMVPDCPPGKHGTFGSPPIRLSRDYPPLSDLCGNPVRDWFVSRFAGDREFGGGFLQGEYLLWWMPGMRIPVLATTSVDPNGLGFLGAPGTVPLLSDEIIGSNRQGVRVRGGLWLDDCGSCGIDASLFVLWRRTADVAFNSSQFGIITRPIFSPNIIPGIGFIGETGEAVTVPNVLTGGLSAHAESFMWGADMNIRHCLCSGCDWKVMGFAGYRFLYLEEQLSIQEDILVVGTSPRVVIPDPVGTMIVVRDTFEVENQFHGGQVGVTYERRRGRWDVGCSRLDRDGRHASGTQHRRVPGPHASRSAAHDVPRRVARGRAEHRQLHPRSLQRRPRGHAQRRLLADSELQGVRRVQLPLLDQRAFVPASRSIAWWTSRSFPTLPGDPVRPAAARGAVQPVATCGSPECSSASSGAGRDSLRVGSGVA